VLLATIPSSRGALSAGLGLFFTMMMLSGASPPPEVLTGAMHWVSNLLPLTYILRLLQDPWLALPWSLTDTAVAAAFTLAAALSARVGLLRWPVCWVPRRHAPGSFGESQDLRPWPER
jgi:ABC-type multidrug transport system permease subunit